MLHNVAMTTADETLNRLFRALGDTTRRTIIAELGKRDRQSLFELFTRVVTNHGIGQTRQGFSRHLTALEQAGLIEIEWQGTTKLHRLNTAPIAELKSGWLKSFEEE
ncbi:ArsR/SmtB family transcription factor [Pelagibacterium sp.]|uniref:ArsR/SmtB family transcription factor n=2 Tax=Pelagibacterium sp. TaxID=1967288 RepID=UPI003BA9A0BF